MKTTKITEQILHLAINIAAGLEPIGWLNEDEPLFTTGNPKGAFEAASNDQIAWGYYYDDIAFNVVRNRQLTRDEFKKEYSAYRLYISQCYPETYENPKHDCHTKKVN